MTCFSLRVLWSITTMADSWVLPFHTENQTSSPLLLYSGCTTRFGPSPKPAISAILTTSYGLSRLAMSNTATDWLISALGWSAVSTHRFLDFGWVLMNSEPPPWLLSERTTFQAFFGCFAGSVPISAMESSPRWPVAHTGPNFGSTKFAPRPGCGIFPTSTSAESLSVLVSTTAILFDWLAATRK